MEGSSEIADFFAGRSVFLTGITGFLGKVVIEKLLRSCPDIGNVYVLVREKKGLKGKDRLNQITSEKLFSTLQRDTPDVFNKLVVVPGDLHEPDMGISNADRERMIHDVSVVIHSAASVRFDEPLRIATSSNVRATKRVIDFCYELQNLKVYVHVSTTYCHCHQKELREEVSPALITPTNLLNITEWMDDSMLESLEPKLYEGRPNSYTFTKAVAEVLVQEHATSLPAVIVRPSIITGTAKEPFAGWIDNFNGPTGLLIALAKGVLTSVYGDISKVTDFIPVDMVANCVIAAAWSRGTGRTQKLSVYNMSSGADNPLTWQYFMDCVQKMPYKIPSKLTFRYPQPRHTNSKLLHKVRMFFQHYLVAQAGDVALWAVGKKPILSRLYDKVENHLDMLEYFSTKEWYFYNDNVRALYSELNATDKDVFNFDVKTIEWKPYLLSYCFGIREFVLKEDLSTVEEGKRQLARLYVVSKVSSLILILGAWRVLKMISLDPIDMVYTASSFIQELVDGV
ncbi:putative fatty acyl-CoA reductase CG5065 isoform X1 [Amblyomma americanum]